MCDPRLRRELPYPHPWPYVSSSYIDLHTPALPCFTQLALIDFLGLASAFGKAGSAIGSTVFTSILARYSNSSDPNKGSQVAFLIGSAFAVLGAICALLLLPDTPKDLEVEDEAFREYLEANGFDTSQMGMGAARREKTTDEEVGDEKVVMEKGEKQVVVAEQPVVGY